MVRRALRRALTSALTSALLMLLMLGGCDVSVDDFERWRNREGSEQKFVEWMLDPESSDAVRQKAVEMLVEQYQYSRDYLPQIGELPPEQRDRAIMGAIPHIVSLFEGQPYSDGGEGTLTLDPVYVRDSAIIVMGTTDNPEVQNEILERVVWVWLKTLYDPCSTRVGRYPNTTILNMLGSERGLPSVEAIITDEDHPQEEERRVCQASYMSEVEWYGDVTDQLARAYVARWRSDPPTTEYIQAYYTMAMIDLADSPILKEFMFSQLINHHDDLGEDTIFRFFEYVEPLTTAEDAARYADVVNKVEGASRWWALLQILRLRGADGVEQAMAAIPDAGVWGQWQGYILPNGLAHAISGTCGYEGIAQLGDAGRVAFEQHIENGNLVARAFSLICLKVLGNEATVELLTPLQETEATLPYWTLEGQPRMTVGELVTDVIDFINIRMAFVRAEESVSTALGAGRGVATPQEG